MSADWLLAEMTRARQRYAKLPRCYRPVVTPPVAKPRALHESDDAHRLDWPADTDAQRRTADGTALL